MDVYGRMFYRKFSLDLQGGEALDYFIGLFGDEIISYISVALGLIGTIIAFRDTDKAAKKRTGRKSVV